MIIERIVYGRTQPTMTLGGVAYSGMLDRRADGARCLCVSTRGSRPRLIEAATIKLVVLDGAKHDLSELDHERRAAAVQSIMDAGVERREAKGR